MARITVRVAAGTREDALLGWRDGVLRVRVRAPAERGKANDAVCRLIANTLGVPATTVSLLHGATSRDKHIEIVGIDDMEARRKLGHSPR